MIWTVRPFDTVCGGCGVSLPPLAPIALVTPRQLVRCASCAGVPVDRVEIAHERWRVAHEQQLDAERRAAAAARYAATPPTRYRKPRPMLPATVAMAGVLDPKRESLPVGDRE